MRALAFFLVGPSHPAHQSRALFGFAPSLALHGHGCGDTLAHSPCSFAPAHQLRVLLALAIRAQPALMSKVGATVGRTTRPVAEEAGCALVLRAAFNAGAWGYGDSWALSAAHARLWLHAPFLVTSYSREEAEDDADTFAAADFDAHVDASGARGEATAAHDGGGEPAAEAMRYRAVGWGPERNPWGSVQLWAPTCAAAAAAAARGGDAAEEAGCAEGVEGRERVESLSENRFWQCLGVPPPVVVSAT